MPTADQIAVGAFAVSIASALVAIFAWRTSAKALKFSQAVHGESRLNEFEKLRAELLIQISESRRQLDRTRVEIGTLEAAYQSEPQPVQMLLKQYRESLFRELLPGIVGAIAQLDDLWRDVTGWTAAKPYSEIMAAKAVLHRSSKHDEQVVDSANYMMREYNDRLVKAKEYVAGATR